MKPLLCLLGCFLLQSALAGENTTGFTLDLPAASDQTLTSWLGKVSESSENTFAALHFSITPPSDNSDLAATFYFEESTGGFLRAYWTAGEKAQMLSENLYEGIGMPNQRTLLIRRSVLSGPGVLTLQSSEKTVGVWRTHWEWVKPKAVLVSEEISSPTLIDAQKKLLDATEVNGDPVPSPSDQWRGQVITAPLAEKPARVEAGVEFVTLLESVPQLARLEMQLAGVPPEKRVTLWMNGVKSGEVSLEIPDLSDPGYRNDPAGPLQYVGWRKGTICLDAKNLRVGENRFQFSLVDRSPSESSTPLAVKDLLLQMKYPSLATPIIPPVPESKAPEAPSNSTSSSQQAQPLHEPELPERMP